MKPTTLLNKDGHPTDEFLQFIRDYTPEKMPILVFIDTLAEAWYFRNRGFKLHRQYKSKRKLELHTGGWSGNEEVIEAILSNFYLTHCQMQYVQWIIGGYYYFEIIMK